jgi:hypothetical protein
MGLPISFPFERDKLYPIGELRAFQTQLSQTRQQDPVLSANIRAGKLPWAKLCCEELVPIMLFADHNRLPDDAEFRIKPEGNAVDVVLCWSGDCPCEEQAAHSEQVPHWDAHHSVSWLGSVSMISGLPW